MTNRTLDDFLSVCETWQHRRVTEAAAFTRSGLRAFVELMNYETRQLIAITGKNDPNFWSAVAELATQAQTLTTENAKLFVDGQNRTNL